jgi:hypothetical protein
VLATQGKKCRRIIEDSAGCVARIVT